MSRPEQHWRRIRGEMVAVRVFNAQILKVLGDWEKLLVDS
jgi:hypothetical protein